jgi:hypothetical protein
MFSVSSNLRRHVKTHQTQYGVIDPDGRRIDMMEGGGIGEEDDDEAMSEGSEGDDWLVYGHHRAFGGSLNEVYHLEM